VPLLLYLTASSRGSLPATATMEQKLLRVSEVFVYKVPTLRSSTGYRAEEWGDLSSPLLTGSLELHRSDDALIVRIYRPAPDRNGPPGNTKDVLFARTDVNLRSSAVPKVEGDINPLHAVVERAHVAPVADSSRYFVLTVVDGKRSARVGIGFRERDDAVDFRSALQDYTNGVWREIRAAAMSAEGAEVAEIPQTGEFTLKEGEKIHVNVKGGRRREKKSSTGGGGGLLLKPPPPPVRLESDRDDTTEGAADSAEANPVAAAAATEEDDDWGDFEGSG